MLSNFRKINRPILYAIIAEFFIQLINSSFMTIQPLYMQKLGYSDGQTADFISYRFLGVLLFALPLGLIIKNRKIKPFFYIASAGVPVFAILIILSIKYNVYWLIHISQFMWGACFCFFNTPILPFILRNSNKESYTEAISLNFSTWSISGILGGILISVLSKIDPVYFSEEIILLIISCIGFLNFYFIHSIRINEYIPPKREKKHFEFDWGLIIKAIIPSLIIAVGAGLTIPFISLFFSNVHQMSTAEFSFWSSLAYVLVAFSAILVPAIKRNIGYKIAVPTTQSFAVLALILLATTQYYNQYTIAVYIAIICYLLRQPLMNMASPMTSDMVMSYVGPRNREMVSALTSAIWSGSWFISSRIFKVLRDQGFQYVNVFLITAALYSIGVIWYYFLIADYNIRERKGLITD